ncbi:MAG: ATP-binding cassette domain-containing protein [Christensenellales bacterium]
MDKATSGTITVGGKQITGLRGPQLTDYRRTDVGFVFQFYNLMPNLTALENVELARQVCKNALDPKTVMEQVGLGSRMNNFPAQLSGGEQQRVSIARALCKNPALLLCDEPTGALDSKTGVQVLSLLTDVCRTHDATVVIITHNAMIAPLGNRVIHVKNGGIESGADLRSSRPRGGYRMVNNTLRKKLFRDMSRAAMQFLSIIALCALGTFAFSALDGTARMTRTTLNTYYEENNLADYWISLPTADRAALDKVASVSGVTRVRARTTVDMDTTLSDDITVSVTAYDGAMDINIPLLREGELLDENDKRGCLVEERFAVAQNLSLGSRIGVKLSGQEYDFVVRGIVVSPEYIVVSNGLVANPDAYGYLLVNACAIPTLPLTQIVANIDDDADSEAVQAAIEEAVPDALVVDRRSHASTARANNEAQMFENMTLIFPVLAYAVAALIVMTTLSRMIDNQRMQMGTLKALGFSSRQIRNHYLSYALVPSAIGAVLGTIIGHFTLPTLLWDTLLSQDEMPYKLTPPISKPAWVMTALCVMMSLGILLYSYQKSAKECTAALLRPKPPKDGKRILF